MNRLRFAAAAIAGLAVLGVCGLATAQERTGEPKQTVESAMKFLELTSADGLPFNSSHPAALRNADAGSYRRPSWFELGSGLKFTAGPGACVSEAHGVRRYRAEQQVPLKAGKVKWTPASPLAEPAQLTMQIPWNKVASVQQASDKRNVVLVDAPWGRLEVYYPTEAIASRVAYAMSFLNEQCDPLRGTGF